MKLWDLAIIGGGINGSGIAAEAALRGLSVLLCEQDDLASGTSSASSKLIHGGLRYLEYGHLALVRKALNEREILLRKAPHLIQIMTFVLPHHNDMRPHWLLRCGLWLYDHLSTANSLPRARSISLIDNTWGAPLQKQYQKGFCYSDCWVDDARLVILNAQQAQQHNSHILTRHQLLDANNKKDHWQLQLRDQQTHEISQYNAKLLVNAAGPWVNSLSQYIHTSPQVNLKLVKGSHIVVPRLYAGTHAYILQNFDKRVIFILPYQQHFHLIGTTEIVHTQNLQNVHITDEEIHYLCDSVNAYLQKPIHKTDILHTFAGVRALRDDADHAYRAISRDYELLLSETPLTAPLLTVLGGKITTYRQLAVQALDRLMPYFPHATPILSNQISLPGGDFEHADFAAFQQQLKHDYPWLEPELTERYARSYGTLAYKLLTDCNDQLALGKHFGHGLYAQEVNYLCHAEWAQTTTDILWRRTKLGLHFTEQETHALQTYLNERINTPHSIAPS